MTRKLALVGMGKMGRAVAELAPPRGWDVVATLGRNDTAGGIPKAALKGAQVAIEFTTPAAAATNIRAIVDAGCPVVIGTTGWTAELDEISRFVESKGGAMLAAANFSLGVNIFERVVEVAARLLGRAPMFDAHLIETHHSAKKDAPSGTAAMLGRTASAAWGRDQAIPITSVRTGSVPGTHELIFDSAFEQIHLEHVARDRRVFAEGALVAAEWLIAEPRHGVFTMRDVLATSQSTESKGAQ